MIDVHHLTLDNDVLSELPAAAFARGAINPAAIMIGANSFDGIAPWRRPLLPNTTGAMLADLQRRWGTSAGAAVDAGAAMAAYDVAASFGGNVPAAFVQLDGDETVVCPTKTLAAAAARHLAPGSVFAYYFQHRYGLDVSYAFGLLNPAAPACGVRGGWNCTWASHFSEVAFVFGVSARSPTLPFTAGEAALHREMMARWDLSALPRVCNLRPPTRRRPPANAPPVCTSCLSTVRKPMSVCSPTAIDCSPHLASCGG